jgi:hypothetical protein
MRPTAHGTVRDVLAPRSSMSPTIVLNDATPDFRGHIRRRV